MMVDIDSRLGFSEAVVVRTSSSDGVWLRGKPV